MTKVFNTLFSLSILAVSLTACGNQGMPLSQMQRPGVQSLRAQQPAAPVRSNAVLDAVAKRMRFVGFQGLDRDRNGQLTAQEFPLNMPGMNLTSFDKNKDGQLSFAEYDKAMQASKPYGTNRETLRNYAQQMWQQINRDNNTVLLRAEIEEYFTAPYNNPPMPIPVAPPSSIPGEPSPIASTAPGYSDPYNGGYPAQPNWEQMKYEARKQAIDFFVQADANLDQKLSFSEYEDGYAKQMLSGSENSLSGNYPYYYPSPGYGYPGGGYGGGYGSGTGVYPSATPIRR